MDLNAVFGIIGLCAQASLAVLVWVKASPTRGVSFAALFAAAVATYGYGLAVSLLMLFSIGWQVANVSILLACAIAVARSRSLRTDVHTAVQSARTTLRRHWSAAVIIVSAAAFQLFVAALKPELSIDGQLYHGPVLSNIIRTGSLWGWSSTTQYIYYTDLTMATGVNLATFTGQARFDDTIQTMHLIVLMLVVIWALRGRFASSFTRAGIAALIVSAPVIWMQPRILYVDLAYGAVVALAVLMIVLIRNWRTAELVLIAIAVASIVATKPTGILTGAALGVLAFVVVCVRRARSHLPARRWLGEPLAAFAIAAVSSLSFYIRNFVAFGNPVYPVKVEAGRFQFPGIIDLSVFASGDRGNGLLDPERLRVFARSLRSGMTDGVTKLDYDPRAGGFGEVPLILAILIALVLISQVVFRISRRDWTGLWPSFWPQQLAIAAISLAVLMVQPAAFDTRYVIGPFVALCVCLALTSLGAVRLRLVELLAGGLALTSALAMVSWTETHVYPGLSTLLGLRTTSAQWQPTTPGNPWGSSEKVAWLPSDLSCQAITIEWSGGVQEWGNAESSELTVLPYGLSGQALCNTVTPVLKAQLIGSDGQLVAGAGSLPFGSSNFIILFEQNVAAWKSAVPESASCWTEVARIAPTESYPQGLDVFRNTCAP